MQKKLSGNQIRQEFIDFFIKKGHKFVASSSLVPGGDQTLLFTNAGMVQFKDIFLGVEKRDFQRAVNSQKCMRVAGKHNDLDDVGRDDTHHTFFEMLGNWSFGDYYKKEAITWAWELLTKEWGLEKDRLWATCFKDEKSEIETDQEAADAWLTQPGFVKEHVVYFGRKDNFWEMADVGPCGPCSEIHFDRGENACDQKNDPQHHCGVNSSCGRFLELWNLVFIQYNRISADKLDSLPSKHVDTGMGFERIVSVLQGVNSNYKTDLLLPLMDVVMDLCGQSVEKRDENITPYRVIADHSRAAAFLISDGVVPGNIGRNYICRMIIRRAARFGSKLGLNQPFLAKVAEKVIEIYGQAYPELNKNRNAVMDGLTHEEIRFQETVESGLAVLDDEIAALNRKNETILDGETAFELYATHGLPLEITKDVLGEYGKQVDEEKFHSAMEAHRIQSGAGKEFGPMGGKDAEFFSDLFSCLITEKSISSEGVHYNPYTQHEVEAKIISIIKNGKSVKQLKEKETGMLIIGNTGFYIEAGGQVSDTGWIQSKDSSNQFKVQDVRKPASGIIIHIGEMSSGNIKVGEEVIARVDLERRRDIMRNHTATHLLHAELRKVLGDHVRQAGSLVAPDRLRFDFTHPKALSDEELNRIERGVNEEILNNFSLRIEQKKLQEALDEGAMALFGEKYSEDVRTIAIGGEETISYELCGGTHVDETAEIGHFIILNEGSVAAGIRRIEAITGKKALEIIIDRKSKIQRVAYMLECSPNDIESAVEKSLKKLEDLEKQVQDLGRSQARQDYDSAKSKIISIDKAEVLILKSEDLENTIIRELADVFRKEYPFGIALFVNEVKGEKIEIMATVSDNLVDQGYHAGNMIQKITSEIGGKGGGRPQLAQGGGNDRKKLERILQNIQAYLR